MKDFGIDEANMFEFWDVSNEDSVSFRRKF